jgi:hypothetical protein
MEAKSRAQAEVMPEYEMSKILQPSSCCCTPSSSSAAGDLVPPNLRPSSRCAAGFMAAAGMVYVESLWSVTSIVRYKMGLGLVQPWWARQ